MKILRAGEVTIGRDYTNMINEAIGTNFKRIEKCTVDLDQFGVSNVIAWFVYMDGSKHGYPDGWEWTNMLSFDGKTIREYNVSTDKKRLKIKQNEEGYHPYRLCFQLDPNGTKRKYWCKFLGAYRFSKFLENDLNAFEYVKVKDEFKIGSIGDAFNPELNSKNDFLNNAEAYKIPIETMGFSNETYKILQIGSIKNAGDLLELGIGTNGKIADEIRQKLLQFFC